MGVSEARAVEMSQGTICRGALVVSIAERSATLDGVSLDLTPKEFDLLVLFAANPGRLLRRDRIAREVWGSAVPGRSIDVHVARLRRRLPSRSIDTVVRLGYRFVLG
jgi:two-component system, OmpR family, alkaline phosphatase synthesis response regulator PhoP